MATGRLVRVPPPTPFKPFWELATVGTLCVMAFMSWLPGVYPMADFHVYLAGAQAVATDSDLYGTTANGLPFTYPPFAAAMFLPVLGLPLGAAELTWSAASLGAALLSLVVLARQAALTHTARIIVLLAVLAIEPVQRTVTLGQVNTVIVLLVVVDLLLLPPRWRGSLIGVASGIKLTPAIFSVLFLARRDWAAVVRAAVGFITTLAVGWIVSPTASSFYWSGGAFELERFGAGRLADPDNQSMLGAMVRLWPTTESWYDTWPVVLGLGAVMGIALAAVCDRRGDTLGALTVVALIGLLVSPVSWTHHWVWIIPLLVWLASRGRFGALFLVTVVFWSRIVWWSALGLSGAYGQGDTSLGWRLADSAYTLAALVAIVAVTWAGTAKEAG